VTKNEKQHKPPVFIRPKAAGKLCAAEPGGGNSNPVAPTIFIWMDPSQPGGNFNGNLNGNRRAFFPRLPVVKCFSSGQKKTESAG